MKAKIIPVRVIPFIYISILLCLPLLTTGCIDKPIAPSWDVEANAPFIRKSYTLLDVISKDSTHLTASTDPTKLGLLYYTQDTSIRAIVVDDKLKLNPIQTSSNVALGTIQINDPAPVSASISSTQINPLFVGGSTLPAVPGFTQNNLTQTMPTITSFSTATFDQGSMNISIKNHLGNNLSVTVSQVRILDASNNTLVSSSASLTLSYDQSGVISIDLANKTLVNNMKVVVNVTSAGSTQSVVIPSDAALSINAQFASLDPKSVTASIPQQNPKSFNGSFAIDNDPNSAISRIVIKQGNLNFSITNNFKVQLKVQVTLPNLLTPTNPFVYNATVEAGATSSLTSAMPGWVISLPTLNNAIQYTGVVTVMGSTTPVALSKTDNVSVNVKMDELTLTSLSGKIKTTALDPSSKTVQVKLGNLKNFNASAINFKNFGLTVPVGSSPTLKLGFSGTITGFNKTTQDSIVIPQTVLSGSGAIQTLTFNQTQLDQFISKFYNTPPDSLRINYAPVINPTPLASDPPGQIAATDSVFGRLSIHTPLDVGVSSGKLTDTVQINISNTNKDQLDRIGSVTVNLNVSNGLPVAVSFTGKLYDAFGTYVMPFPPVHAPNPTTVSIPGATTDANQFADPAKPGVTTITLQLTGAEMQTFLNSKKMIVTLSLDTSLPNGSPVNFRSSDAISVTGTGSINYTVQP